MKWWVACIALAVACSKPASRAPARAHTTEALTAKAEEGTNANPGRAASGTAGRFESEGAEAPSGIAQPPAPAPVPFHPPEHRAPGFLAKGGDGISLGISRNALVSKLGKCAHRVGGSSDEPGVHRVEVFRPEGKRCEERFGKLSYFVVDGYLEQIVETQTPSSTIADTPGLERRDSQPR